MIVIGDAAGTSPTASIAALSTNRTGNEPFLNHGKIWFYIGYKAEAEGIKVPSPGR